MQLVARDLRCNRWREDWCLLPTPKRCYFPAYWEIILSEWGIVLVLDGTILRRFGLGMVSGVVLVFGGGAYRRMISVVTSSICCSHLFSKTISGMSRAWTYLGF